MPGVPFEMENAMCDEIIPRLQERFQITEYLSRSCIVTGISESALATQLAEYELELPKGFSLAYLPSLGYIRLRLSVWGEEHKVELKLQARKLKKLLGLNIVSKGAKMPEEILGGKLRKKNLTLSTAESCTGGFISHKITTVPGSSQYFEGSIISYDSLIKEELLDVDRDLIETYGVVSGEVVEQMARTVAKKLHTDCSIAVSGIMGPDGGTKENPVGTVWIATQYNDKIISNKYNVGRSRRENVERTANTAMLQLLQMLKS
ncbi:nicotinamide-nucleotide amidohydrolase family protein [Lascolabacillus massiliensis]|uniref:nicotinamide-nucleotide amidohydrolase family protein n=1 Tax=Lascolabacillus massiliensis TaxID=1627894 RepID=UPI000A9DEE8D|nr:nicotinamide-nucleotide amidohydrolase family protein [Lascolabacillus massiliensis]